MVGVARVALPPSRFPLGADHPSEFFFLHFHFLGLFSVFGSSCYVCPNTIPFPPFPSPLAYHRYIISCRYFIIYKRIDTSLFYFFPLVPHRTYTILPDHIVLFIYFSRCRLFSRRGVTSF
jgi:hypothetical protein